MATYKIEVRERAEHPNFVATYEVDALSPDQAISEAKRRFLDSHPDKDPDKHSFERAR